MYIECVCTVDFVSARVTVFIYAWVFLCLHMCKCSECIWLSMLFPHFHSGRELVAWHLMSHLLGAAYGVFFMSASSTISVDANWERCGEWAWGAYLCVYRHKHWYHTLFVMECTKRGDAEGAAGIGNFLHFIQCHNSMSPLQMKTEYVSRAGF